MIYALRTYTAIARAGKDNRQARRIDARINTLVRSYDRQ